MSEAQPELTMDGDVGEAAPAAAPAAPAPSWRDGLPADIRDHPTISRFSSTADLAKSYLNAQKFIGGEKLPKPREDWTEEQWGQFYTALGRPENGYDMAGFEPPEGVPWDNEFLETMVGKLYEAGLSQQQLERVLSDYSEIVSGQWQSFEASASQAQQAATNQLKKEWGNAYSAKVDSAVRAFKTATGRDFETVANIKLEDGTLLGNHPSVIKAFAALGDKFAEHGIEGEKNVRYTMTPEEASREQKKLLADPEFFRAYTDRAHIDHENAVERIRSLIAMEVGTDLAE